MYSVYLAGGLSGPDWRARVVEALEGKFQFLVPLSQEKLKQPAEQYTIRDEFYVKQADIVFIFIYNEKRHAEGTAWEAGLAKGLGKTVIFIEEYGNKMRDRFVFIKERADIVFGRLEEGIEFLRTLAEDYGE
jgi:nucleoside 2-deoxyribosyltransferase